ncbi:MAG: signal transduction protein [Acidimicrobiales bacterium]|nr:MAG: signal transduction protein [Acidimicrobiales bacterium]
MLISEVLKKKGSTVATVAPDMTIDHVVAALAEHGVGALVVSVDGNSVDGIISERDVVRALAVDGAATLTRTAGDLMTAEVVTCSRDATIEQLMAEMTERRFRHVPVTENGRLIGIVSIGDVVNARVHNLEIATERLTNYISGY